MSAYYESAEETTITKARALQELKRHGAEGDFNEFLADMGDKAEYNAQDVLAWLGY